MPRDSVRERRATGGSFGGARLGAAEMSVEQARAALDAVLEQSMAFVDAIRLAMSSQAHADDLARHRDEQAAAHKALVECLTALDDADEDVDGDPARRDLVQVWAWVPLNDSCSDECVFRVSSLATKFFLGCCNDSTRSGTG